MIELNERFYELVTEENEESISDVDWHSYDALSKLAVKEVSV